ncbi:MAG TPA: TIGR03790 family protein [Verrucomicrobiae bacterium]
MSARILKTLLVLLIGSAAPFVHADSGADVVVVYNDRSPESKRVAEYYAEKRQVPKEQIIALHLSREEIITREDYKKELEEPLWRALLAKKLITLRPDAADATIIAPSVAEAKIRYAVLCYGVPVKISKAVGLVEAGIEKLPEALRENYAAVDSELSLLPMKTRNLSITGPLNSPFYGITNSAMLHPTNGILMVTRLDGPSEAIAKGLVDKALEAEKDGLWGRSYIDLRNIKEGEYKQGDDWIRQASEVTSKLGWETIIDNKPETFPAAFPMSQVGFYFGWYEGNLSGPFAWGEAEFLPGAFAYHLHSFSADSIRATNRNWVGPLLAKGVTATMGCVYEPYLGGTPDIGTFAVRWLHNRFSFGEAAYAGSPVLSWQTTVIGDPLYRPMVKGPEIRHAELMTKENPLIEWSHLKIVNLNLVRSTTPKEMIGYLNQTATTRTSNVLQEKLGDLWMLEKKPEEAAKAYALALDLKPTKKQQLRLLFAQADTLAALEKSTEAVDVYLKIERLYPDYPDMMGLYQKLLPVAQKAKRTEVVEKCQKALQPK